MTLACGRSDPTLGSFRTGELLGSIAILLRNLPGLLLAPTGTMGEESGSTTPPDDCILEWITSVLLDGPMGELFSSEEGRMIRLLAMPSLLTGNCVSPTDVLIALGTKGAKGDEATMPILEVDGTGGGGISDLAATLLPGVLGNKGRT